MQGRFKKIVAGVLGLLILAVIGVRVIAPLMLESSLNRQIFFPDQKVADATRMLHTDMLIMDWHTDTLLWNRNLLDQAERGHADVPRLQSAGFDLMMFTTVTKSPRGQNIGKNTGDSDNITPLVMVQGWPMRTWNSLLERALYQAEKLDHAVMDSGGSLAWVRNKSELTSHLEARQNSAAPHSVGALLGSEGAHPLEGKLENIDLMFEAGYRMMGITHFFDNELAGSLHGVSKAGLTDFGRAAIARFDELEMIIDLAHVSEAAAYEILALSSRAPVVSHTGLKGHCDTARNFSDDLMKAIAAKGGLIAVGFWQEAICTPTPTGIAAAIDYGIKLVGEDHIVIGSDWDGSTESITAPDFPLITQALQKLGYSEASIRKVMGQNSVQFLQRWLPNG
ncbi:MAG: membrane dipeptidase [Kordiimonadaceae bacterium]|nr:membrane dipeptidase [Kordiimonadaceae bacterium]MBO6569170.1 membrane dipeptidase [Kordiimonadaceae bacterium]MBO6964646.1 membrane dipeptidase [Kordiimonadaceae bacterium]